MSRPFILCENLVKIYKVEDVEVVALQGLDLVVDRGELMAIIGPSGSGKTSLLNVLGGLDVPSAGKAWVADVDLTRMTYSERVQYRRKTVGFVWQNVGRNLIPYLTALENVMMPMIISGTFRRQRAHELLELVGLGKRKRHIPRHLSGGEQQRVAVAIALANQPGVLLADEPTGSLDTENSSHLLQIFDEVRRRLDVSVLIVTHDYAMAKAVDRYVEIRDGKTSKEAVRRAVSGGGVPTSNHVPGAEHDIAAPAAAEDTHDHYTLLDSAGRLQIPADLLDKFGIQSRARLIEKKNGIFITSPETLQNAPGSNPTTDAQAESSGSPEDDSANTG